MSGAPSCSAGRQFLWSALLLVSSGGCADGQGTPEAPVGYVFQDHTPRGSTWYKGNTHAHTTRSDGDSPPDEVARWYRDHGYDFLVLSDHNVFTDPQGLDHVTSDAFLLIPGEEVTSSFDGAPVHVNALNIPGLVEPQLDTSLVGTLQKNVDAIREVDGAPHINHPNFRWAFGFEELVQVEGDRLLEIWNGHPQVHNVGVPTSAGIERVWDMLLSSGKVVYGIAVDDAHHFQGEFAADRANPGRGWVVVRAPSLEPAEIVWALENGHFYASTGPVLDDVRVSGDRYEITIQPQGDFRYVTYFMGENGTIHAAVEGIQPSIRLPGPVRYIRARVMDSQGRSAWTQPAFTTLRQGADTVDPLRFLALGDSYTIGEGVDPVLSWPEAFARALEDAGRAVDPPRVIARTGWTTDELESALDEETPAEDAWDIVSLLIGVNDQYRGRSREEFEAGFDRLLERAIAYSSRGAAGVVVLSIPDWGATPFAADRDRASIAEEIDRFNASARTRTEASGATWVDVTELSRRVADNPGMATDDGLHLDGRMYQLWVLELMANADLFLPAS